MNNAVVLDASALLTLIQNEPGAATVEAAIIQGKAIISAVNFSEVISKLAEGGMSVTSLESFAVQLPVEVIDFNAAMALEAGLLRLSTRQLGLSLGDRACLATAKALDNLPVMTANRAWGDLKLDLLITLIRT
ncbi:MAG: type II toxin-antitoxin system VapC family toxin [Methylococcales bacterium]